MQRCSLAEPSGDTSVHPCCLPGFPFLSTPAHPHLSPPVNTVSRSAFSIHPFLPTAAMLLSLPSAPGLAQQPPRSPLHSAGHQLTGGVAPLLRICRMNSKMLSTGPQAAPDLPLQDPLRPPPDSTIHSCLFLEHAGHAFFHIRAQNCLPPDVPKAHLLISLRSLLKWHLPGLS